MIYRIYPQKDATIYEDNVRKSQNTGKDEILEVGKFYDTDDTTLLGNSRALIQFNLNELKSLVDAGTITSPQYRLRLENIESREIQSDYNLYTFPLKESWEEGIGKVDYPLKDQSVTWTQRLSGSSWDTANSTVDKPLDAATVGALEAYYDFVGSTGGFTLVEPINGTLGELPSVQAIDGKLVLSSSNFSGGTANLSASLEDAKIYNIHFDFNRDTLSGVDFNVIDPSGSRLNDEIVGYKESISATGTYKLGFTSSMAGQYKIQYTFFDTNGSDGSSGNIDNFLLFATTPPGTLILDQFTVESDTLPTTYTLNQPITGDAGNPQTTGSAVISNSKMKLNSNGFGGATLNRKYYLQADAGYTASFDLDSGNYKTTYADGTAQGIEFDIIDPDGRVVDTNDLTGYVKNITSSLSPSISFNARQNGDYLFRWTFFASGSYSASGSLDNFNLVSFNVDTTSSLYTDVFYDARWSVTEGGGTWFTSSFNGLHYTQSFDKYTESFDTNVTQYVTEWIDGTRNNNGFIIKKKNVDESSSTKFGTIKFFSSDTHTIYPPVLETRWDDSSFVTGSLSSLVADDIVVYVKNLQTEYKEKSKGKIRVFGRERYPSRSFASNPLKSVKYLPTTSYYSIVDADTDQVIIPFDTNYTKLSCDSSGNYFNFWFNGLQPERFYKFCFRVDQGGTTRYYDDNFYFKVVR